jgi:hypothetical protein
MRPDPRVRRHGATVIRLVRNRSASAIARDKQRRCARLVDHRTIYRLCNDLHGLHDGLHRLWLHRLHRLWRRRIGLNHGFDNIVLGRPRV